jgi:hypothetical protein
MRLKDRVAIVVGAGQSPGEGIGNGRATALTFAREGPGAVRRPQPCFGSGDRRDDPRRAGGGSVLLPMSRECRHQRDGGGYSQPRGRRYPANISVSLSAAMLLLDIWEAFDRWWR